MSLYVQCCVSGCTKDPCVMLQVKEYEVSYCENHVWVGLSTKQALLRGTPPEKIKHISPARISKHSKVKKKKVIEMTAAAIDWEWEDTFDMWRNAAGTVVRINKLETSEIIDAVLAISKQHIVRHTAETSWIKELDSDGEPRYVYPTKSLLVPRSDAMSKLEELREEASNRGVL